MEEAGEGWVGATRDGVQGRQGDCYEVEPWPGVEAGCSQELLVTWAFFAGKLLDATKVYKYVFILAGAEVLTSSLVLLLGNFFCIGKRPEATQPEEGALKEEKLHKAPVDVRVDSREVEHFLKAEPEKNGEVVHTPETSV